MTTSSYQNQSNFIFTPTLTEHVSLKIKSLDLEDYVLEINDNQIFILLQGALNLVFNGVINQQIVQCNNENPDDDFSWESVENEIFENTVTQMLEAGGHLNFYTDSGGLDEVAVQDFDVDYRAMYESMLFNLSHKLSDDVNEDPYNQEIISLFDDMLLANSLNLENYMYKTPENYLHITISFN